MVSTRSEYQGKKLYQMLQNGQMTEFAEIFDQL